jgi:hypothetical protein
LKNSGKPSYLDLILKQGGNLLKSRETRPESLLKAFGLRENSEKKKKKGMNSV